MDHKHLRLEGCAHDLLLAVRLKKRLSIRRPLGLKIVLFASKWNRGNFRNRLPPFLNDPRYMVRDKTKSLLSARRRLGRMPPRGPLRRVRLMHQSRLCDGSSISNV
jgi:hypothetical protein